MKHLRPVNRKARRIDDQVSSLKTPVLIGKDVGMDVVALRKKYGRSLRMWGGVDKRTLTLGRAAIDRELERVKPLIDDGGYIPMLDHSATPDTPYENFTYFLERLKTVL